MRTLTGSSSSFSLIFFLLSGYFVIHSVDGLVDLVVPSDGLQIKSK